jgi:hypothetical protein
MNDTWREKFNGWQKTLANERITAATTFPSSCFTPLCLHAAVISPPPSFPDSTFLKTTFCSSSSRHSLPQNLPVKVIEYTVAVMVLLWTKTLSHYRRSTVFRQPAICLLSFSSIRLRISFSHLHLIPLVLNSIHSLQFSPQFILFLNCSSTGRRWFVPAETNLRASPPARRDSCSVTSQPREKDDLLFNLCVTHEK